MAHRADCTRFDDCRGVWIGSPLRETGTNDVPDANLRMPFATPWDRPAYPGPRTGVREDLAHGPGPVGAAVGKGLTLE